MNKIYNIGKFIFLIGIFIIAQQSLQSAPTQLSPQNGDGCVDRDATFQWNSVKNASHYMFLLSTKADFSDTLRRNLNYPDTTISSLLPDNGTNYYWKVGSFIIGQDDDWSEGFTLTTKPAAPVQLLPIDLQVCQDFQQTFSWDSIENAVEYRLMISATPNFSDVKFDTTIKTTSIDLTMKKYFQNYYWRVNGRITGCNSEWSAVRQFRTVIGPPDMTFPADSAKGIDLGITFTWPTTAGADSYELQVSDDANFNNLLVNKSGLVVTSFDFLAPNYNTNYWWRMRTISQGCNSEWSKPYIFKTAYKQALAIDPGDTVRCVSLNTKFTWNKVEFATKYQIQVSSTELFGTKDMLFEQTNFSDTTITGYVKNASARIYWRVRANDSNNLGLWSEIKSFFTTGDAPISLSPVDGAVEVPRGVEIKWQSIGQTQSFDLEISRNAQFNDIDLEYQGIVDLKKDVVLSDYNTQYYYRVRASFNGCLSDWSQVFSFKSIQGFPNLISPYNSESNLTTDLQLKWSLVPTAINYDFRIATDDQFVNYKGQNGVISNSYLFKGLDPNTTYYWMVRSNDQWGTSPWSQVFSFTTGAGYTNVPTIILPENGNVKEPIAGTIKWTSSENATSYTLQISTDRKFNTVDKEVKDIMDTTYDYSGLDNFTEYWVRVASVNETTTSDFSNAHKFRTIALPPSDKGLAITPTDGATSIPYQKINFTWTKVPRTDLGLASESGYEFLLSKSEDYSDTVLYDQRVFEDGKLYIDIFTNGTTYFWKIRGWNEAGFGPWSDSFSFSTDPNTSVSDANYFDFGATVVPNPVENNAELRFNLEKPSKATLSIVDQTGKVVYRLDNIQAKSNQNTINLNLNNFSNGSYLFNLTIGDKHQTGKIIISR